MHSPLRRPATALAGLVVEAGLALATAAPGGAASIGEGATEEQILSEKLPNVPGNQADRDEGRRHDGPTNAEREELTRLRREKTPRPSKA